MGVKLRQCSDFENKLVWVFVYYYCLFVLMRMLNVIERLSEIQNRIFSRIGYCGNC